MSSSSPPPSSRPAAAEFPRRVVTVGGHQVEIATAGEERRARPSSSSQASAKTGPTGTWSPARSRSMRGCSPTRVRATAPAARPRPREIQKNDCRGVAGPPGCPGIRPSLRARRSFERAERTWSCSRNRIPTRCSAPCSSTLATATSSPHARRRCWTTAASRSRRSPQQPSTVIDEYHAFALASDEMRAAGTFGAYPVRVDGDEP